MSRSFLYLRGRKLNNQFAFCLTGLLAVIFLLLWNIHPVIAISVAPSLNPLAGSFMETSRYFLTPGQELTFTITLHNSSFHEVITDISDPLPADVSIVEGSVDILGSYDTETNTIQWSEITVPAGGNVILSFRVTTSTNKPTPLTNAAKITYDMATFERSALFMIVPTLPDKDDISPVVKSFTIDHQDILTDRNVKLYTTAQDNIVVDHMYIREWQLTDQPYSHWEVVQSSGWVPFESEYDWTLGELSGTHFIGVWVADKENNKSHLSWTSADFASLIVPGETLQQSMMVPYLVNYNQGVEVTANLTPTSGDADLFVWYPWNFDQPDQNSTQSEDVPEQISFTTPTSGTYLFMVQAYSDSTYDLTITPPGGFDMHTLANSPSQTEKHALRASTNTSTTKSLFAESILSAAGLDPLGIDSATVPNGPIFVFMPLMTMR